MSADAYHISAPHPEGEGAALVMRRALHDAGLEPQAIGYINAHGTSTPLGDLGEVKAVHRVFGDHAHALAVSSTKSSTGHLLGAAGGLESGILALALHHQTLPPTINLDTPGEGCDLDFVPHQPRAVRPRVRPHQLLRLRRHQRRHHHAPLERRTQDATRCCALVRLTPHDMAPYPIGPVPPPINNRVTLDHCAWVVVAKCRRVGAILQIFIGGKAGPSGRLGGKIRAFPDVHRNSRIGIWVRADTASTNQRRLDR